MFCNFTKYYLKTNYRINLSFQPCLIPVMNLKSHGKKFLQPRSDPRNVLTKFGYLNDNYTSLCHIIIWLSDYIKLMWNELTPQSTKQKFPVKIEACNWLDHTYTHTHTHTYTHIVKLSLTNYIGRLYNPWQVSNTADLHTQSEDAIVSSLFYGC